MEQRNYLKLAALVIAIGACAITLNAFFSALVTEWKKDESSQVTKLSWRDEYGRLH